MLDDAGIRGLVMAMMAEMAALGDRIGLPLARLMASRASAAERQGLDRLLVDLPDLGGSNAQRDLFLLGLTQVAGQVGDTVAVARLRAARAALKADDRLIARIAGSIAH